MLLHVIVPLFLSALLARLLFSRTSKMKNKIPEGEILSATVTIHSNDNVQETVRRVRKMFDEQLEQRNK